MQKGGGRGIDFVFNGDYIPQYIILQSYLSKLNKEQKEAVMDITGPSLVLAGPGSGKTFVIVNRVAYMLDRGIDPSNIVLFTFTKKAADELKDRIEAMVGRQAHNITVGTYHSVCARLLRRYAHHLGYNNNFTIYSQDDSKQILKNILEDHDVLTVETLLSQIERHKRDNKTPAEVRNRATLDAEIEIADFYSKYQNKLKESNAMDFSDLIVNVVRLLGNNYNVAEEITNQYRYIISDETQDSNLIDFDLIKLLGSKNNNICLIADDDQSIFGFRGANFNKIMDVLENKEFSEHQLKQNYRSTSTIVDASRSLIRYNSQKRNKTIYTHNKKGPGIIYYREVDAKAEANRAIRIIKTMHNKNDIPYEDMAILYRTNSMSPVFEEALLKNNIPYRIVKGTSFAERMEIKDIISYLKFYSNPYDSLSFERIINTPRRKIGAKSLETILALVNDRKSGIIDGNRVNILSACKDTNLTGVSSNGLDNFIAIFDTIDMNRKKGVYNNVGDIISDIINLTGYLTHIEGYDEAGDRVENLSELIEIAKEYIEIDDFLESAMVSSINTSEDEVKQDKLNLLTMHSSKGLEYKVVIIVGANEGQCPHYLSRTPEEVEEERRLFYVAITRAEEFLFITSKRYNNGRNAYYAEESRFMSEIDPQYLIRVNQESRIKSII